MKSPYLIFALAVVSPALALEPVIGREPIRYSDSTAFTAITRIAARIAEGEKLLTGTTDRDVLRELLDLLNIPVESQVLVYSKTSAQNNLISPRTPRAIYFSDNAYVGWVQRGNIETITFDEKLGVVFHMIHLTKRQSGKPPGITRDRSCLDCHGGSATSGFPGPVVRSVYPTESGLPLFHAGSFRTDDTSPLDERWGGWYVTGSSEGQEHLGNILVEEGGEGEVVVEKIVTEPVEDLSVHISTDPYPGGGSSDIVSLMVLEHQKRVHNALVQANLTVRQMLYRHERMREAFGEPKDAPPTDTNLRILVHQAERVVETLLFKDEFDMGSAGIDGSSGFVDMFESKALKDSDQRSLRDLRLYERLFKYRCSYMIYSEAFDHLPPLLKETILARLSVVLKGEANGDGFDYLGDSERERIVNILSETLPGGWSE